MTKEELKRQSGEQKTVVKKSFPKLVNSDFKRFVSMVVCVSRTFPRVVLRQISGIEYFNEYQCCYWTVHVKNCFRSGVNIGSKDRMVRLELLLVMGVAMYRYTFAANGTVLAKLAKEWLESASGLSGLKWQ